MFKVGDKVRRTIPSCNPSRFGHAGHIYTVASVSSTGPTISLQELEGSADASCFELVEDNPVESIIEEVVTKRLKSGWHENLYVREKSERGIDLNFRYDCYNLEGIEKIISQLTEVRDYLKEKSQEKK